MEPYRFHLDFYFNSDLDVVFRKSICRHKSMGNLACVADKLMKWMEIRTNDVKMGVEGINSI